MGRSACPSVFLAFVYLHEGMLSYVRKCESMRFWSTICVPMDCVYRARHKAAVLCVPMCEGNKPAFGQFAGPNILAATGQTDPQLEWPYRGRGAKYTESLTSVGQQQCTTTHGPTGVAQQHA